jgi:hypothetical protein
VLLVLLVAVGTAVRWVMIVVGVMRTRSIWKKKKGPLVSLVSSTRLKRRLLIFDKKERA